jgi:4-amino-4-deoxy-L-arabinose transferase-like glycosyltransferase
MEGRGVKERDEAHSDPPASWASTWWDKVSGWRFTVPVGIVLATASNGLWVLLQRRGQPYDADEAGYLSISLRDFHAMQHGGPTAWIREILMQSKQAPLAPALASVVHLVSGPSVLNAYLISILAYGVVLCFTNGVTRGWTRGAQLLTLLLVACAPVLLLYSRGFIFATLAAACLTGVLYFQQRSQVFTRTPPAVAWGIALGLLPLARTMTVAFVPALVLGALIPVLVQRQRASLLRFAVGILIAVGVSATWYTRNGTSVYRYLTSNGYGSGAAQFGNARSPLSLNDWWNFLQSLVNFDLFGGLAALIVIGWVMALVVVTMRTSRWRRDGASSTRVVARWWELVGHGPAVVSCGIVSVAGLVALMTSRNEGSGFVAPLIPPLVVVGVWGIVRALGALASRHGPIFGRLNVLTRGLIALLVALVVFAAGLTFLPQTKSVNARISFTSRIKFTIWNSESRYAFEVDAGKVPPRVEPHPLSSTTGRAWVATWVRIAEVIQRKSEFEPKAPIVMFAFNDRMVTPPQIVAQLLLRGQREIEVLQMPPLPPSTKIGRYLALEKKYDPSVNFILTTTSGPDSVGYPLPAHLGAVYAHGLHFKVVARFPLPDGRIVYLWASPNILKAEAH